MPINHKLCFLIMPFEKALEPVMLAVKQVLQGECGYLCIRGDDIYTPGVVIEQICAKIQQAQIVIADASGQNPNVFYEMGLAHALKKDLVIFAQNRKDIPFDVTHQRFFTYDLADLPSLQAMLRKVVEALTRKRPEIKEWISTTSKDVKIGLAHPVDQAVVNANPIEAEGQIVGLPKSETDFRIQAYVVTDREYEQSAARADEEGYWRISQVYLGAKHHKLLFRIYYRDGRLLAESATIRVALD